MGPPGRTRQGGGLRWTRELTRSGRVELVDALEIQMRPMADRRSAPPLSTMDAQRPAGRAHRPESTEPRGPRLQRAAENRSRGEGPWTWARCSPASWRRRGAVAMPLTAKQVVRGSKPAARWWWMSPRGWAPGKVGVRAGAQAAWCVGCLSAASTGASDPRHHRTVANARFEDAARPPSPFGLSLGGTCGRWASSRAPGHRQGTQRLHCHLLAARLSLVGRPRPPGALPPHHGARALTHRSGCSRPRTATWQQLWPNIAALPRRVGTDSHGYARVCPREPPPHSAGPHWMGERRNR